METFNNLFRGVARFQPLQEFGQSFPNVKGKIATYLTNAMILGGLLSLVWKNRLLIILNGLTSAVRGGSSISKGNPSMYKFVELRSCNLSMRYLNVSGQISADPDPERDESEIPLSEFGEGTDP